MEFITKAARTIFWWLDKNIFGLIDDVYGLLLQLARTSIFSQNEIQTFSQRVYALVGIFMLFKVSISIINYVLNPDDMSNNDKGLGSIVKHVLLSLVLIVVTPYIFKEAYELQAIILEENTIMNLVFGTPTSGEPSNSSYADTAGSKIQFTVLYAFAQPNYEDFSGDPDHDLADCKSPYEIENGMFKFRQKPVFEEGGTSDRSKYIYELNVKCWGKYYPEKDEYGNDGSDSKDGQLYLAFGQDGNLYYQNYAQGVAQQSFSLFFRKEVILATVPDGRYLVDYKFGISTAVGVITLYLLILFCIDIAVRSLKLGFLQMIAPIPILSYCDPKSGKDGMFGKWLKMCKNTYLDLFIRLFALYFGIYVISLVGTFRDIITNKNVSGTLVTVFMILGVLIFVKQLPKIISDSLGVDMSGKFEPNLFKKIENEALGGKAITGVAKKGIGVTTGAAAGLIAGGITGRGVFAGVKAGIASGWKGDKIGKRFSNSYSAGKERNKQLDAMAADGVSPLAVTKEKIYNAMPWNGQTRSERIKGISETYKAVQDTYSNYAAALAGTDGIAKEIENRRKAAHEAGDYVQETRWQKAFDTRLKEVSKNKGRISFEAPTANLDSLIDNDGNFYTPGDSFDNYMGATEINNSLNNYASQMKNLIKHLNQTASDVAGFSRIDEKLVDVNDPEYNLKKAMGKAKGVQGDIDSNAANRNIHDVAKYAGGKKNN